MGSLPPHLQAVKCPTQEAQEAKGEEAIHTLPSSTTRKQGLCQEGEERGFTTQPSFSFPVPAQMDKELASGEYFLKESERLERKREQKKVYRVALSVCVCVYQAISHWCLLHRLGRQRP